MAGEDYTSPINGLTFTVPKYEEPADAPVAFKDFADSLVEGGGGEIDFDPTAVGQVVQSADGSTWSAGMAFTISATVPDDTEGNVGDVCFVTGSA
jgi:hypothetical protein